MVTKSKIADGFDFGSMKSREQIKQSKHHGWSITKQVISAIEYNHVYGYTQQHNSVY